MFTINNSIKENINKFKSSNWNTNIYITKIIELLTFLTTEVLKYMSIFQSECLDQVHCQQYFEAYYILMDHLYIYQEDATIIIKLLYDISSSSTCILPLMSFFTGEKAVRPKTSNNCPKYLILYNNIDSYQRRVQFLD